MSVRTVSDVCIGTAELLPHKGGLALHGVREKFHGKAGGQFGYVFTNDTEHEVTAEVGNFRLEPEMKPHCPGRFQVPAATACDSGPVKVRPGGQFLFVLGLEKAKIGELYKFDVTVVQGEHREEFDPELQIDA